MAGCSAITALHDYTCKEEACKCAAVHVCQCLPGVHACSMCVCSEAGASYTCVHNAHAADVQMFRLATCQVSVLLCACECACAAVPRETACRWWCMRLVSWLPWSPPTRAPFSTAWAAAAMSVCSGLPWLNVALVVAACRGH